jgi:methylmalonyl-CoA mutase N-terminal domain/subunit
VDQLGGAVAAVEAGFVQREIEEAAFEYQRQVEAGERLIVGVNGFAEQEGGEEMTLHRLDPEAERRQVERTRRVRAGRDAAAATVALEQVRKAARGAVNLLHPMREALAAYCTVGEICGVLREELGTYDAHAAP